MLFQWKASHGVAGRLPVLLSGLRLALSDLSLGLVQRLKRFGNAPISMYVNGLHFYVDLSALEQAPLLEVWHDRAYERVPGFLAGPGDIVVDIGANIGAFTMRQAQRGASVYAFEPNIGPYSRLQKAIHSNGLQRRVCAANLAMGASAGWGTLVVQGGNSTGGSIDVEKNGGIRLTTLKLLCEERSVKQISLLKIDAEGSEFAILLGATDILDRIQRIVLEYHSSELKQKCTALLTAKGFAIIGNITYTMELGILFAKRERALVETERLGQVGQISSRDA